MRSTPKRPRIEDVGLRRWLNNSRQEHNGNGYTEFIDMLESDIRYSKAQIARAFNVVPKTIYDWMHRLDSEGGEHGSTGNTEN